MGMERIHTKASLMKDLQEMGVKPTDTIMVHSSMKAIGQVEGGAYIKRELFTTAQERIEPNEMFYFEPIYLHTAKRNYSFTKENEMIAYERYQESVKGRVFFDLFEKINMRDFIKRFEYPVSIKQVLFLNFRLHFCLNFDKSQST